MGDEREFKIKITTSADASGAQKTTAELDNLGGAQERAGKQAEKHEGHLRAMHRVFHALDEVVPGLGILMQAAFSPVGAAISGALIVLRLFQEKMQEVNAEFKKMSEEAALPATNRMAAWRDATVQAAEEMDRLHRSLADAEQGQQTLKDATDKATAASREQAQTAETLAEALKDNELATLDEMHEAGLMSEQQYADQKLKIELDYEKKKRELQEGEAMREVLIRQRNAEQAELAQPGLTAGAEAATRRKVVALEDLGSLDKSGVEERKKNADAALKAFREKHGQWAEWFEPFGTGARAQDVGTQLANQKDLSAFQASGGFRGMFGGAGLSEAYTEWARLKTASQGANAEWAQYPRAEAQRKVAADTATEEADRALKAALANQTFITDTKRDIEERRSQFSASHVANQELGDIQGDTMNRRSPSVRLLQEAVAAEQILQHGGRISMAQQVQIKAAAEMVTQALHVHGEAVLASYAKMRKDILELAQQIRHQASPP